jgi:aspartokinase/homoserine dehydrogenase 1
VLRYIGKLENGKVEITLQTVDESHPFYMMSGSDNIISFTTNRYSQRPMVVKGPGAGAEVTAAGVFADIINIGKR